MIMMHQKHCMQNSVLTQVKSHLDSHSFKFFCEKSSQTVYPFLILFKFFPTSTSFGDSFLLLVLLTTLTDQLKKSQSQN